MARRPRAVVEEPGARSARFDIVLTELFAGARCSIVVGVTLADAWARARADWPNIDQSHDAGDAACVVDVDGQCVMLLSCSPTFDVYAHEAVHVAVWVMTTYGVPVKAKTEELVAYLVQWVVRAGWPAVSAWTPVPTQAAASP